MNKSTGNDNWLPLRRACRLLGVNESSLRHWADAGHIRSFRTPGGHRRFAREDLLSLVGGQAPPPATAWGARVLRRIRSHLHRARAVSQTWKQGFDEPGRERMRLLGQQLVQLAQDSLSHPARHAPSRAEARRLGEEYGQELARCQLPLGEVLAAFIFFRRILEETMQESVLAGNTGESTTFSAKTITTLVDEVLLGMGQAYEAARFSPAPVEEGP